MWREFLYAAGGDATTIYLFIVLLMVLLWFGLWSRHLHR